MDHAPHLDNTYGSFLVSFNFLPLGLTSFPQIRCRLHQCGCCSHVSLTTRLNPLGLIRVFLSEQTIRRYP